MEADTCLLLIFLEICRFVIQQIHPLHPAAKLREWSRVAAVGIAARLIWQIGSLLISDKQRLVSA